MKTLMVALMSCGVLITGPAAVAQTVATPTPPSTPAVTAAAHYTSEESTIGDLLDNPATKAMATMPSATSTSIRVKPRCLTAAPGRP